jgi:integrase
MLFTEDIPMPKRERGSGGLFKLKGCKYFYAQIYDKDGRPRRMSTRTTVKQEALAVLRNLLVDRDKGTQFLGDAKKIRYEELRTALLQNYIERGNKSLMTMADGSETIWGLKALDEFFKEYPVSKITTDAAREFAQKRLADGASNGTINRSLALLRRMIAIAHEDAKIQNKPKIRLLKAGPARKGFLPREKFDELLSHIPVQTKPLIVFLYYCGVRLGEALQITWEQVDLPGAVIRLEGEQTKNADPRTVPLPDVLVRTLQAVEDKTGTVFDGTNLRKIWQNVCVAAGLGSLTEIEGNADPRYTGLLVHDLRRSAIRNLVRAGVTEKVAMAISGHKTRSVFDRYNIVDVQDVVQAMRKVQDSTPKVPVQSTGKLRLRAPRRKLLTA